MFRFSIVALAIPFFVVAAVLPQSEQPIDIKVVKYDGLCDAVSQSKGKVVVVDVWAHW
jgi:hypothetical protein